MRIGEDAASHARSRVGSYMPDEGLCLQFTRENYPAAPLYYSAVDAWHATIQHPTGGPDGDTPPVGVPVWYRSSSPYRHVAIHVGGGEVVTTFNDEIRLYPTVASLTGTFGPYAGWGELLNDVRVWSPDVPEQDGELDMYMIQRNNTNGSVALIGPGWYVPLGAASVKAWTPDLGAPRVRSAADYDTQLACLVQGVTAAAAELRAP